MSRYERWNALLDRLAKEGGIEVDSAAADLGVSAATIRRDLDQLAHQGMLTRRRGGAIASNVSYELPLRYKTARHPSEKQRIAQAAARLVAPGATVGLNGGTTTTEVARALAARLDPQDGRRAASLTIVTNAMNIANELALRPQLRIIVVGGTVRPQSYEIVGPFAAAVLEQLTLDHVILGVDAIDASLGASAHHEGEASINRLMASRGRRLTVVADSSKLGDRAFAQICPPEEVDVLVTDSAASDEVVASFQERGIEVVRA